MIRFVVDRHLGELARWIRTLGYDAFFQVDCSDESLKNEALLPHSILVTTTQEIARRIGPPRSLIVPAGDLRGQVQLVVQATGEPLGQRMFTRCVICNAPVLHVPKEKARGHVSDVVFQNIGSFTTCPSCGRLYWEGTHTARLRRRLATILGNHQTP